MWLRAVAKQTHVEVVLCWRGPYDDDDDGDDGHVLTARRRDHHNEMWHVYVLEMLFTRAQLSTYNKEAHETSAIRQC